MPSKSGNDLTVSEEIREEIASYKPVMCTVEDVRRFSLGKSIVSVGDVTSATLRRANIPIFLDIVDLKTKRKSDGTFAHIEGSLRLKNPPAMLTANLFSAIKEVFRDSKPRRIEIDGEEDLAVIPIIFYSDLNTVVVYGVPDKGMACIDISQKDKDYVTGLIKRMENE